MSDLPIHLIRHGRPDCPARRHLNRVEYGRWLESYAAAGIVDQPPEAIGHFVRAADDCMIFASSLPRSIQSARRFAGPLSIRSEPVFDEAFLSVLPIPVRLGSGGWTVIGRMVWLLGGAAPERVSDCRLRAQAAAEMLMASARSVETVLVGHGWMNRMIGRELLRQGLRITGRNGRGYWSRISLGR